MWLQRCRSTAAYPGLAFGAGLLHLPMISLVEADQEQVAEVDRLIAVSIPVVNGIDLGSNHDQLWPVRKVTNMTMGSRSLRLVGIYFDINARKMRINR